MGGADIIPGVSGGTIALILGVYERLVTAISHVDRHLFTLLAERRWSQAGNYLDLRFLLALGVGIGTGILCLARLMRYLLLEERMYTMAVFFGLILASSVIVARKVYPPTRAKACQGLLLAAVAAGAAYWLVGLQQAHLYDHYAYYFFCGSLAICAMILPGISGAYILWLLGAYEAVTGILENLLHGQLSSHQLISLAAFLAGCMFGLISFSKLLHWLLANAHATTMAVLAGFMVGSLRGIWPFQVDLTPDVEKLKLKRYEQYLPESWSHEVFFCIVLAATAMSAILLLEFFSRSKKSTADVTTE